MKADQDFFRDFSCQMYLNCLRLRHEVANVYRVYEPLKLLKCKINHELH